MAGSDADTANMKRRSGLFTNTSAHVSDADSDEQMSGKHGSLHYENIISDGRNTPTSKDRSSVIRKYKKNQRRKQRHERDLAKL